ncbi:MAG: riboflavin biosynthesis protein RibD [Cryomorphaceae bacterium MED-G11]|nr:MAG: riboflavin biosynthesis protein RibD [Cryomorphaceae bacterium MED-G11]
MEDNLKYIKRCIELASKEIGNTYPNPLVGCVIVHENKIIGEGSHKAYGDEHAEVNAINSVNDKNLLAKSTLYVNLEPCNHYGKTPPCSDLILKYKIKNVVIGSIDPNKTVKGGGIEKLESNGCNVTYGILKNECDYLNKRFFTYHKQRRPYVILKWAESNDGFISPIKSKREVYWISGEKSKKLSHKWRSEEHSILVGVQTIIDDNPILTTRLVDGKNPIRIVLDPNCRIPINSKIFSKDSKTIILSKTENNSIEKNIKIVNYDKMEFILRSLYDLKIQSVIIEGGAKTIKNF